MYCRVKRIPGALLVLLCVTGASAFEGEPGVAQAEIVSNVNVVAEVVVDCRAHVDKTEVRRLVDLRAGDAWNPGLIPEITARIRSTELFNEISIESQSTPAGVAVVVHLVRKPVISRIRFHGNHALGNEALRRATRLQEGMVLTQAAVDYATEHLQGAYQDEGFEEVSVSVAYWEIEAADLDVVFEISEGKPILIDAVHFEGDAVLSAEDLQDAIDMKPGERFRRKHLRDAEHALEIALRKARYYEAQVDAHWQPVDVQNGALRFSIEAGPRFEVLFEGNDQLSSDDLLALIDIERRVVVTDGTWRELGRRIRHAYQERGYYEAVLSLKISEAPSSKRVVFEITEGEHFTVAPIQFEGRDGVSVDTLRDSMLTGPPGWIPWRRGTFVQEDFDEDLKRLWYLYRRYGFMDAQIADYRIRPAQAAGQIEITVIIEEGLPTIAREVRLIGFDDLGVQLPSLKQTIGAPLDAGALDADRQRLEALLHDAGYLSGTVELRIVNQPAADHEDAQVQFVAAPGVQAHVGKIIAQNNFDTQARVLRRELPFHEGDVLRAEDLVVGQTNLYRLGLFRSVALEPLSGAELATRDVAVNVSERPPIGLQFGAGYNTRDGFRGFVEVAHSNLQGRGRRLSLRGDAAIDPSQQAEPNEYLGDLGYREPRIADSRWNLRSNVVVQRATRSIDQFSIERLAFIPAIDRVLFPGLQVGLELQGESARIFDVKPDVLAFNPRDEGRLNTLSLGPYLVYEGRDDPFAPTRGVFDSVRLRIAPPGVGSDIPFVKLQAQHSHYIPVGNFTLVYAARGGWARSLVTDEIVPLRERFFLGGRTTVRGFKENSVGPQGAPIFDGNGKRVFDGGNPLGGDLALNLNLELRMPLLFGVYGVVFGDGGGVYLQQRDIRIADFRRSAGVGVLYTTPVGPLALHYGFKLDRRRGESAGDVHFSIGTIF